MKTEKHGIDLDLVVQMELISKEKWILNPEANQWIGSKFRNSQKAKK